MSLSQIDGEQEGSFSEKACTSEPESGNRWYAIWVRANQEIIASESLKARGLEQFLPLFNSRRRWSDRVKIVKTPLIPGYVFCRFALNRISLALGAAGCVQVVRFDGKPAAVEDSEIEAVRLVSESKLASPCPYVREGMRVRVQTGAFKDLEGFVQRVMNQDRLVVSLHLLQRSVSVQIETEAVGVVQ